MYSASNLSSSCNLAKPDSPNLTHLRPQRNRLLFPLQTLRHLLPPHSSLFGIVISHFPHSSSLDLFTQHPVSKTSMPSKIVLLNIPRPETRSNQLFRSFAPAWIHSRQEVDINGHVPCSPPFHILSAWQRSRLTRNWLQGSVHGCRIECV
jgi:hypothetical protein